MISEIEVTIVQRVTFRFPSLENQCSAHGKALCLMCARNPGGCEGDQGGCATYPVTGMHWDTCSNRISGPMEADEE